MHRLLYRSQCAIEGSPAQVDAAIARLVAASQHANRQVELTGALLIASGVFVHVLEGPCRAVETTFERICADLRHVAVRLVEFAPVDERSFADSALLPLRPTDDLARICTSLDTIQGIHSGPSSAAATVEFMRAMAATQPEWLPEASIAGAI